MTDVEGFALLNGSESGSKIVGYNLKIVFVIGNDPCANGGIPLHVVNIGDKLDVHLVFGHKKYEPISSNFDADIAKRGRWRK